MCGADNTMFSITKNTIKGRIGIPVDREGQID